MSFRCVCQLLVVFSCLAIPATGAGESRRMQQVGERRMANRNSAALPLVRIAGKRRSVESRRSDSPRELAEQSPETWEFRRLERPELLRRLSQRSADEPVPSVISEPAPIWTRAETASDQVPVRAKQDPVETSPSDWLVPQRLQMLPTGLGLGADA